MYLAIIFLVVYALILMGFSRQVWAALTLVHADEGITPPDESVQHHPAVTMLVPVKDEEDNISRCVKSILAQDYPNARMIVVNDRSTDRTPEILRSLQEHHSQLQCLDITELPEGMFGKPHALHRAAPQLTGEIVIFVDSDFQLKPHCISTLVQHLQDKKLDWLAVMGKPELSTFWERLLVPVFGAMVYAWFDPRKISDPDWPDAIGSGFMLARREAYEAIGGHGAVVNAYDEDSELMRIAKRAGQKVAYVLGPELFDLRLYGSLKKTVSGFNRTLIGGLKTLSRFAITITSLFVVSLLPLGILAGIGLSILANYPIIWTPAWLVMSIIHVLLSAILGWVIYRTSGVNPAFTFLQPVAVLMLIAISLRAAIQLKRFKTIQWRGTEYNKVERSASDAHAT